jgi:thiamine phosphate synthase YjbQ (UPF0047 family)
LPETDGEIMTVESQELRFRTHREGEILDITDKTQRIVDSSKLKNGVAALFVPGSTGALTTIEYEPGLLTDFPIALERFAPKRRLTSMRIVGMMATDIHTLERP